MLEAEVAFNKGFQQREHKGTKEKPCKRGFLCGPSVTKAYKERDHRQGYGAISVSRGSHRSRIARRGRAQKADRDKK